MQKAGVDRPSSRSSAYPVESLLSDPSETSQTFRLHFLHFVVLKQTKGPAPCHPALRKTDLSKELQSNQPQRLTGQAEFAGQRENVAENLCGASYAIGKVLGEVWDHPLMDFSELKVASSMCFFALADGNSGVTVTQISGESRRDLRKNQEAMQKLAEAGFVRAIRPSQIDLDRGELAAKWVFQSPFDRVLGR